MQTTTKKANGKGKAARQKIVLAYSGGLDTSIAIRWLADTYDADVVCVLVDVGQPSEGFQAALAKAKKIGAVASYGIDARAEFARDFEVSIQALAPDLKVIAPAREWVYTREEGIKWAEERGIPVPASKKSPYSVDENLWGRSAESGILEDADVEPPEDCYGWTVAAEDAPEKARYVTVTFDAGVPVALDGVKMGLDDLILRLNEVAGRHGVGRIDHIENRLVGIKSREVYEAPAAVVLTEAHRQLESMVLPRDLVHFKYGVEDRFAEMVYDGLWFTPLMASLQAFLASSQERVTGDIRVKLLKGAATVVGRTSPYSIYDTSLATYGVGDLFNHGSARGFIDLWGLPTRIYASRAVPQGLSEGATEKVSGTSEPASLPKGSRGGK